MILSTIYYYHNWANKHTDVLVKILELSHESYFVFLQIGLTILVLSAIHKKFEQTVLLKFPKALAG